MTTASDYLAHTRRNTTQNARSTGPIRGRRFRKTVESCWRRARVSIMRPPCERNPEESAAMIPQRSRIREAGEAAGPGRKRQWISMERGFGEGQVRFGK